MKTFSVMVLAAVMALVLAPAALAENKAASAENKAAFYVTPKIGFSSMTAKTGGGSESKNVVPFGLAFGYDFNPVRVELEYAYRAKKEFYNETYENAPINSWPGGTLLGYSDVTQKGKLGVQSFFLNGYYDIHNSSSITPYVGLGLGFGKVSYEVSGVVKDSPITHQESPYSFSGSKTKFAWNIGGGAAWQLSDSMALDLGYRYANFGKFSTVEFDYSDSGGGWVLEANDVKTSAHDVMLGLRFSF